VIGMEGSPWRVQFSEVASSPRVKVLELESMGGL
jgi:hypothetical protein